MRNKTKPYDVFFVDDEPEICKIMSEELQGAGCKVSCFDNAAQCLEKLPNQDCDLLITDVKMPGMDGITLLSKAKQIAPWVSVIVITGFGDIPMAVRALKLGALDFIEKPLDRNNFLQKVKSVLEKINFTDSYVSQPLTKLEKRVLRLILEGEGNKQIAYQLSRSLRTIELHRSHIMHKFGVDNIVDLVKKTALMDLDNIE
jgi:two-component system response regulator TtrR